MLSKVIILCYSLPYDFHVPNLMTMQKGKGYQGTRSVKMFEYINTRSGVKCCNHLEKKKNNMSDKSYMYTRPPGAFSIKLPLILIMLQMN